MNGRIMSESGNLCKMGGGRTSGEGRTGDGGRRGRGGTQDRTNLRGHRKEVGTPSLISYWYCSLLLVNNSRWKFRREGEEEGGGDDGSAAAEGPKIL